ncbi:uncharacterized protein LOC34623954, partial [Cyclospora cayetanensis]|uniref:Uncharacterized protein LOC34623954 n=1 Tax=Cyclospora cayetanensis TaxID=88456 RepID=A0A6P6S1J3_9EIME
MKGDSRERLAPPSAGEQLLPVQVVAGRTAAQQLPQATLEPARCADMRNCSRSPDSKDPSYPPSVAQQLKALLLPPLFGGPRCCSSSSSSDSPAVSPALDGGFVPADPQGSPTLLTSSVSSAAAAAAAAVVAAQSLAGRFPSGGTDTLPGAPLENSFHGCQRADNASVLAATRRAEGEDPLPEAAVPLSGLSLERLILPIPSNFGSLLVSPSHAHKPPGDPSTRSSPAFEEEQHPLMQQQRIGGLEEEASEAPWQFASLTASIDSAAATTANAAGAVDSSEEALEYEEELQEAPHCGQQMQEKLLQHGVVCGSVNNKGLVKKATAAAAPRSLPRGRGKAAGVPKHPGGPSRHRGGPFCSLCCSGDKFIFLYAAAAADRAVSTGVTIVTEDAEAQDAAAAEEAQTPDACASERTAVTEAEARQEEERNNEGNTLPQTPQELRGSPQKPQQEQQLEQEEQQEEEQQKRPQPDEEEEQQQLPSAIKQWTCESRVGVPEGGVAPSDSLQLLACGFRALSHSGTKMPAAVCLAALRHLCTQVFLGATTMEGVAGLRDLIGSLASDDSPVRQKKEQQLGRSQTDRSSAPAPASSSARKEASLAGAPQAADEEAEFLLRETPLESNSLYLLAEKAPKVCGVSLDTQRLSFLSYFQCQRAERRVRRGLSPSGRGRGRCSKRFSFSSPAGFCRAFWRAVLWRRAHELQRCLDIRVATTHAAANAAAASASAEGVVGAFAVPHGLRKLQQTVREASSKPVPHGREQEAPTVRRDYEEREATASAFLLQQQRQSEQLRQQQQEATPAESDMRGCANTAASTRSFATNAAPPKGAPPKKYATAETAGMLSTLAVAIASSWGGKSGQQKPREPEGSGKTHTTGAVPRGGDPSLHSVLHEKYSPRRLSSSPRRSCPAMPASAEVAAANARSATAVSSIESLLLHTPAALLPSSMSASTRPSSASKFPRSPDLHGNGSRSIESCAFFRGECVQPPAAGGAADVAHRVLPPLPVVAAAGDAKCGGPTQSAGSALPSSTESILEAVLRLPKVHGVCFDKQNCSFMAQLQHKGRRQCRHFKVKKHGSVQKAYSEAIASRRQMERDVHSACKGAPVDVHAGAVGRHLQLNEATGKEASPLDAHDALQGKRRGGQKQRTRSEPYALEHNGELGGMHRGGRGTQRDISGPQSHTATVAAATAAAVVAAAAAERGRAAAALAAAAATNGKSAFGSSHSAAKRLHSDGRVPPPLPPPAAAAALTATAAAEALAGVGDGEQLPHLQRMQQLGALLLRGPLGRALGGVSELSQRLSMAPANPLSSSSNSCAPVSASESEAKEDSHARLQRRAEAALLSLHSSSAEAGEGRYEDLIAAAAAAGAACGGSSSRSPLSEAARGNRFLTGAKAASCVSLESREHMDALLHAVSAADTAANAKGSALGSSGKGVTAPAALPLRAASHAAEGLHPPSRVQLDQGRRAEIKEGILEAKRRRPAAAAAGPASLRCALDAQQHGRMQQPLQQQQQTGVPSLLELASLLASGSEQQKQLLLLLAETVAAATRSLRPSGSANGGSAQKESRALSDGASFARLEKPTAGELSSRPEQPLAAPIGVPSMPTPKGAVAAAEDAVASQLAAARGPSLVRSTAAASPQPKAQADPPLWGPLLQLLQQQQQQQKQWQQQKRQQQQH